MSILIAGVVIWYNPIELHVNYLREYIDGLEKLYIVDNSDNKLPADLLSKIAANLKIKYIAVGQNVGIAAALNIGARNAIEDGFNWILTMDQDSRFDRKLINQLRSFAEHNSQINIGVVSAVPSCSLAHIGAGLPNWEFTQTAFTSGNLVNIDAFTKVGGWDEKLFIDGVDYDYDFRVQLAGFKLVRCNNCVFEHSLGNTKYYKIAGQKLFAGTHHNFIRRYYITRNRLYINRHYKNTFPEFVVSERYANFKDLIKILLVERDKCRKIQSILRGYRDYHKGILGKYRW